MALMTHLMAQPEARPRSWNELGGDWFQLGNNAISGGEWQAPQPRRVLAQLGRSISTRPDPTERRGLAGIRCRQLVASQLSSSGERPINAVRGSSAPIASTADSQAGRDARFRRKLSPTADMLWCR
jgi:hypothetical protein